MISTNYWWNRRPDDENEPRRRDVGAGAPGGSPEAAPGTATAGASPAQAPGGGESGALLRFFQANRGEGGNILRNLAGNLSTRMATAQGRLEAVPTVGAQVPILNAAGEGGYGAGAAQNENLWRSAYNQAQSDLAAKGAEASARNVAGIQPLGQELGQWGTGEGFQTSLERQFGSGNYTPGQARLDAWLAGAAAQQSPSYAQNLQNAYSTLQKQAGTTQTAPTNQTEYVRQWLLANAGRLGLPYNVS